MSDRPSSRSRSAGFGTGAFKGFSSMRGGLVDHRMARRATINEFHRGRLGREEVCDAHPELMRAARSVGKQTETPCPICADSNLVLVTYVFGAKLPSHGRLAANDKELAAFHRRPEELTAYVVEACCACRWHYLVRAIPIGGQRGRRQVG